MRRSLTGLAATALALPMLSACIIVADGDSSSTQINLYAQRYDDTDPARV